MTKKASKTKKKIILTKGKKKTSIARARIREVKKGLGTYKVNKRPIELVEPKLVKTEMMIPLYIASELLGKDVIQNLDIDVNVRGGGIMGQAEAVKAAVAKGLLEFTENEDLRKAYLEYDRNLLVDDIRRKEPKKPMRKGARARYQKSFR